jgi:chitin disaccharide deacetylase
MAAKRYLIVNADDFGRSQGVNQGIIQAHEHGIVTSASLMVRWEAAAEAAAYARGNPRLSLGLHVDLGEWSYREQAWLPVYEVVPLNDPTAVAAEVARQLGMFRRLAGQEPTHIDSHQHIHQHEPARSILLTISHNLAVPLRHCSPQVAYCGEFYGQDGTGTPFPENISLKRFKEILSALPAGITELACHPGLDDALDSVYCAERVQEVRVLCDPLIRSTLRHEGIDLCSFRGVFDLGTGAIS